MYTQLRAHKKYISLPKLWIIEKVGAGKDLRDQCDMTPLFCIWED